MGVERIVVAWNEREWVGRGFDYKDWGKTVGIDHSSIFVEFGYNLG